MKRDEFDQAHKTHVKVETELDALVRAVSLTPYVVAIAFLFLLAAYVISFGQNGWSTSPDSWGQLGDYVGGLLNPLVAVFALVALVTSVKLQRSELAATREELRASKRVAEEQAQTMEQQRREQRFFDFLNLYQQTLATVDADGKFGKTAFRHWASSQAIQFSFIYDFMKYGFEPYQQRPQTPKNGRETLRQVQNPTFVQLTADRVVRQWGNFSPILDHYFRTVFAILREAHPTLGEEHFRYVKLFRAQLSRDELALLAFNLLFDDEGAKMRDLVQKYGLLKHLPSGFLRKFAESQLNPGVFGRKWAVASIDTNSLG